MLIKPPSVIIIIVIIIDALTCNQYLDVSSGQSEAKVINFMYFWVISSNASYFINLHVLFIES